MTTRARDSPVDEPSRNKENDPFQVRGSRQQFIPSLSRSPDKNEFFTDTLLDSSDASQHSLIPLPKHTKETLSHPRRKIRAVHPSRNSKVHNKHRATRSELPALPTPNLRNSLVRSLTQDTSPLRSTGLSTPPRSRDGSSIASPLDTFSSPPRALTETYERIDQEEDLAATEGEISDPDNYSAEEEENKPQVGGIKATKQSAIDSTGQRPRSRGSTPTNRVLLHRPPRMREMDLTTASVLSDPTGMSFIRELSNTNLQIALTPHVVESARDRKALEQAWTYRKPVAFSKAGKLAVDNIDLPDRSPAHENVPPRRLIPFSKAGRVKLASELMAKPRHQRTFSDLPPKASQDPKLNNGLHRNDERDNHDSLREAVHLNPRLHRENFFPQNHGFPARDNAKTSDMRDLIEDEVYVRNLGNELPVTAQLQREHINDQPQNSRELEDIMSGIDWIQAAADRPVPTIETAPSFSSEDHHSDTHDLHSSPSKSKRFDIDFTGQSFQVSESPPVRNRIIALDYMRTKEIEGLEKQAVTTNRLSQFRARESSDQARMNERSPMPESIGIERLGDRSWRSNSLNGEKPADTPVINFRTSLPNGIGRQSDVPNSRPSPRSSQSHEILQRLARGSSSTPRSLTPSERNLHMDEVNVSDKRNTAIEGQNEITQAEKFPLEFEPESKWELEVKPESKFIPVQRTVQQTPRVVGAWTDTVLANTVKPTSHHVQASRYAQTPHVSTGAWIDTPAPNVQPTKLEPVIEISQEIPEELMEGIVKDKMIQSGGDDKSGELIENTSEAKVLMAVPQAVDGSLAKKVLVEARGKVRSKHQNFILEDGEPTEQSIADDTLALGSATVQSLENFLDMDETELTILSRIGEEPLGPTETEVISRLALKLDRLRSHIHDAKKGISSLEHQLSQPQQTEQRPPQYTSEGKEVQPACSSCAVVKPTNLEADHILNENKALHEETTAALNTSTLMPFTLLPLTIPIPVLFRPPPAHGRIRRTTSRSNKTITSSTTVSTKAFVTDYLPRPTPLGWLVLTFWTWYVLECTFCEIYSRPQYASQYSWPVLCEPEFPLVLPTMLYRWSRVGVLFQPLMVFVVGIFRIVAMWSGLTDGFFDTTGPGLMTANNVLQQQPGSGVYQQQGGNMAMMDMMNDELL